MGIFLFSILRIIESNRKNVIHELWNLKYLLWICYFRLTMLSVMFVSSENKLKKVLFESESLIFDVMSASNVENNFVSIKKTTDKCDFQL